MTIKNFHEAPNSVFNRVQNQTSGDYCLVHLLEENEEYLHHFSESVNNNREVILDNSIFELGTAFDAVKYAEWIKRLNPTWYIVPDVLEDSNATLKSFYNFKSEYQGKLPGKTIAVAQGKTILDTLHCFETLHNDDFVDMIAISFDLSCYVNLWSLYLNDDATELEKMMYGRRSLILDYLNPLYKVGYFNKPVHLLGTALPQEGLAYKNVSWIYSVDTSNPVVAGFEGVEYIPNVGLKTKSKTKLFTIIDDNVSEKQWFKISNNIKSFKTLWGM